MTEANQPDLFTFDGYPNAPGWKGRATSREAAQGMAPKATTIRDRVLASLKRYPGTPEDIAGRIAEPVMNVRPRFSELAAKGLIEDTGRRGPASGGRWATIWRVTPATAAQTPYCDGPSNP